VFVKCFAKRQGFCFYFIQSKVCADIPIEIRGRIIQIPIETASLQVIIPITAEMSDYRTQQLNKNL
jgi:hypothetical protein